MSTEIDWSKAPEDATHSVDVTGHPWRKTDGKNWWAWIAGGWTYVVQNPDLSYLPRPVIWSGEGLPPVGTVCECQLRGYGEWQKATILAHHNGHAWATGDDGKHCFTVPPHGNFRPIKTAEQIAAEERDKAVHQMGLDAGFHGSVQDFAKRLYMLGYRKVEGGEK